MRQAKQWTAANKMRQAKQPTIQGVFQDCSTFPARGICVKAHAGKLCMFKCLVVDCFASESILGLRLWLCELL
eukprot:1158199-Pelagomonas_calceolata.AAC.7